MTPSEPTNMTRRIGGSLLLTALAAGAMAFSIWGGDPLAVRLFLYLGIVPLVIGAILAVVMVRKERRRAVATACAGLAIFLGVIAQTQFPLTAAHAWSEGDLLALAERVRAGESPKLPVRAGAYTIHAAGQKQDGSVYLWTDPDTAGPSGFVLDYTGRNYNLWSIYQLNEDWCFIAED